MKHFFFFIIFCYIFLFISSHQIHAYTIGPVEDVTVSAYIGITPPPPTITPLIIPTPIQKPAEGRFSLFGYSSPGAKISINNPGMYSDTIADNKGYYEFRNFFSTGPVWSCHYAPMYPSYPIRKGLLYRTHHHASDFIVE